MESPRPKRPKRPYRPPTPIAITPAAAGARIRDARESSGRRRREPLTPTEAAARLGISLGRYCHVESGRKVLSWTRLVHWIQVLDLDPRIVLPELYR